MSRSGYSNDLGDNWQLICWRGMVASATRGKRGQTLLKELVAALDAMPVKRLVAHELEVPERTDPATGEVIQEGAVCALGAVAKLRGISVRGLDPEDSETVAAKFDIADPLAREVVYMNDEGSWNDTPEKRWARMRAWAVGEIATAERAAIKRTRASLDGERHDG